MARDSDNGLFLVNQDGTGLQDLEVRLLHSGRTSFGESSKQVMKVGSTLYLSTYRPGPAADGSDSATPLLSLPWAGGIVTTLGSELGVPLYLWDVADGRAIATYWGPTADLRSFNGTPLSGTPFLGGPVETLYIGQASGRVLFSRRFPDDRYELASALPDASASATLGASALPSLLGVSTGPDPRLWRPGLGLGDRVIFRTLVGMQEEILSCLPDGTALRTLTQASGNKRVVAAWDSMLIYALAPEEGNEDLHAVNADGTGHVTLVDSGADEQFAFLQGDTVVFTRREGGIRNLYTVPLAGGTPTLLVASAADKNPVALR